MYSCIQEILGGLSKCLPTRLLITTEKSPDTDINFYTPAWRRAHARARAHHRRTHTQIICYSRLVYKRTTGGWSICVLPSWIYDHAAVPHALLPKSNDRLATFQTVVVLMQANVGNKRIWSHWRQIQILVDSSPDPAWLSRTDTPKARAPLMDVWKEQNSMSKLAAHSFAVNYSAVYLGFGFVGL